MKTRMRFSQILLCALLIPAFLAGAFPQAAIAAPGAASGEAGSRAKQQCLDRHGVKAGDTLLKLEALYGMSWRKIAEANGIVAPWTIYTGQVLCIPGRKGEDPLPHPVAAPEPETAALAFRVRVKDGLLTVRTARFPAKQFYFVRVDDSRQPGVQWVRLGLLRTGSLPGYVETTYLLPKELARPAALNVCLKNIVTDAVTCTLWKRTGSGE